MRGDLLALRTLRCYVIPKIIGGMVDMAQRGAGEAGPKADLFERLAVVGKAFASPKRLELLDLLTQGERTVEALSRESGVALTTVSAHLQILKMSNLVSTRREGTRIYYRVAGEDVLTLYAAMQDVAREHSADVVRALESYLGGAGLDDVEQVTREELLQRLAEDSVVLLDVRPVEEYAAGHIPGARSLPFGEIDSADAREVWDAVGGREVVAYCRGAWCVMASDAVRLLRDGGSRARRLEDGMLEWRTHGLPVEVAS